MTIEKIIKEYCIALTGGIATGKSRVGGYLRSLDYTVIDADVMSKLAVAPHKPGYEEVLAAFGEEILFWDKSIDRQKLGAIVFNDREKRRQLERILHPRIKENFHGMIEAWDLVNSPAFFFYEIPLLYELDMEDEFREVWCTYCAPATQLQRLMDRNNLSLEEARKRMSSQISAAYKAQAADRVIDTDTSDLPIETQVDMCLKYLIY